MTSAVCLRIAAVSGFLVVALGAFGAHGLKDLLVKQGTLEVWEKAVLYQMFHHAGAVAVGVAPQRARGRGGVFSPRHDHFLRQPIRPSPHQCALARRHHAAGRGGISPRLGLVAAAAVNLRAQA